jgi:hypothetical protein
MDPNYSLQESYKQRGTYGNPRGDNKRQRRWDSATADVIRCTGGTHPLEASEHKLLQCWGQEQV